MFTLIKIRLAQIKYEIKNLVILHVLFLIFIFIILEILLHATFSKHPEWTTLGVSAVIMSLHFSRKDAKFIQLNIEKPFIALLSDYLFLFLPFMSVALFTPHWYCFIALLLLIGLIVCLKFNHNNQPIGLVFLSRLIPSSYFEILSGCRHRPIIILDEPFNGLDLESAKILETIILRLKEKNKTIFISSHILNPLFNVCDTIHHLSGGSFQHAYLPSEFDTLDSHIFGQLRANAESVVQQFL